MLRNYMEYQQTTAWEARQRANLLTIVLETVKIGCLPGDLRDSVAALSYDGIRQERIRC